MKRKTKVAIALVPVSFAALLLDALEPGQGVFYNPLFFVRSQIAKLDTAWRDRPTFSTDDPRLAECLQLTSDNTLGKVQEQARDIVTGKSESFALQQLGSPTCAIAGDTYRWLTESGLAIDLRIEEGTVQDAKLTR